MSPQLDDMAYRAKAEPRAVFTALAHHLTPECLEETWQQLNCQGAPGLSGETREAYGHMRGQRIATLVETLKAHAYRVPPVRRVYTRTAYQTATARHPGSRRPPFASCGEPALDAYL